MIKAENIRINLDIEFNDMDQLNQFRTELTEAVNKVLPADKTSAVSLTYTEITPPKTTTENLKK